MKQREGIFDRWLKRKRAVVREETVPDVQVVPSSEEDLPGDEDMPTLESLDIHSDYSSFLSPKVTEGLRRLALRKLFHSEEFNICDGLDDYADDFTNFAQLGDLITAEMRLRLEEEGKRYMEAAEASEDDDAPVTSDEAGRVVARQADHETTMEEENGIEVEEVI